MRKERRGSLASRSFQKLRARSPRRAESFFFSVICHHCNCSSRLLRSVSSVLQSRSLSQSFDSSAHQHTTCLTTVFDAHRTSFPRLLRASLPVQPSVLARWRHSPSDRREFRCLAIENCIRSLQVSTPSRIHRSSDRAELCVRCAVGRPCSTRLDNPTFSRPSLRNASLERLDFSVFPCRKPSLATRL